MRRGPEEYSIAIFENRIASIKSAGCQFAALIAPYPKGDSRKRTRNMR
jgi:hypothetical protein